MPVSRPRSYLVKDRRRGSFAATANVPFSALSGYTELDPGGIRLYIDGWHQR
jgi:hypothetical protein